MVQAMDSVGLAQVDLAALERVAARLWSQDGRGLRRADLIGLAGTSGDGYAVTIEAGPGRRLPLVILHDRPSPGPWRSPLLDGLSPREREVAVLLAEGLSNKAIARRLGVTIGTVKDHVHRVLGATGCGSRTAFVARYLTATPPGPPPAPTAQEG